MNASALARSGPREVSARACRRHGGCRLPWASSAVRSPLIRRRRQRRFASSTCRPSASHRSTSPRSFSAWRGSPKWNILPLGTRYIPDALAEAEADIVDVERAGTSIPHWMPASRSWCSPAFTVVASNCSATSACVRFATSRGRRSPSTTSAAETTFCSRPCWRTWASTRDRRSTGSPARIAAQRDGPVRRRQGRRLRWLRPAASRAASEEGRACDRRHRDRIAPGPSTSAACSPRTGTFAQRNPIATKRVLRAISQGGRRLRRRARARCPLSRRQAVRTSLSDRAGGDEKRPVHPLARREPGGHTTLPRACGCTKSA